MQSTTLSSIGVHENAYTPATNALFSTLYSELHRLARRELARQGARGRLSVTTVLHEAYLDMCGREGMSFPDEARFMGYAARVMRGLIIDHARSRGAIKRGGDFEITSLEDDMQIASAGANQLSVISDALDQLERVEPELAEIVDLKFFCGLSFVEIAALQNLSERTIQRKWDKARIYLRQSVGTDLSM